MTDQTTKSTKRDTKTDIMIAAQAMMAEHGIVGVSLRAILSEAGANTSALHYHFGSREGLVDAILARYGSEQSRQRLDMVRDAVARDVTPTAMLIASLVVDPMIATLRKDGETARRFHRFLARLQSDRAGIHQSREREHYPEIWDGMQQLLRQVCIGLSDAELELRVQMMIDTMLQSLSNAPFMGESWEGGVDEAELESFATALKDFLAGGLAAPSTLNK